MAWPDQLLPAMTAAWFSYTTGVLLGGASNGDVLAAQASTIRVFMIAEPSFSHVVGRFAVRPPICVYSMPHDKYIPTFEQLSPAGSSRVVAGTADVDEHVTHATSVDAMPRRDLWSVVQSVWPVQCGSLRPIPSPLSPS